MSITFLTYGSHSNYIDASNRLCNQANNLNISFPKIVNLYMSKGVNNKVCKIGGTSRRAFIGLKQIFRSVLDDEDDENAF